jgi:phage terminase large subunit-like protein
MDPLDKDYLEKLDTVTRQKLQAMEALLSYRPNNEKFLAFHKSTAKTRLVLGGRRSGKTTAGIVEICWAALGIHPYLDYPAPPLSIRICSVDFASGKQIILPQLYQWLPKQAINKWWAEDRILELTNGTAIDIKSYDQDVEKFEGVARHVVLMDEEPRNDIYESNVLRTYAKGINGKLIITCTPLHGMTWLYYTLYDNKDAVPPAVEHWHVATAENPNLPEDMEKQIRNDPAMRDNLEASLYGKFFSHEGLVYKQFNYDKHTIAPLTEIPKDWLIVLGIDPHDRNPHGVLFCGLTPQNVWIVFDELLETCVIADLAKKIKAKLGHRWPPNLSVMDTSGNIVQSISGKSVAEELLQTHGLYTIAAHKDIAAGRIKVSSLFDPGDGKKPELYFTRNCHNLIREIRHYIWDDWAYRRKDKMDPKEKPVKKDDHLMDALRYVVMTNIVYRPPGFTVTRKPPEESHKTGYY